MRFYCQGFKDSMVIPAIRRRLVVGLFWLSFLHGARNQGAERTCLFVGFSFSIPTILLAAMADDYQHQNLKSKTTTLARET
jgi:hypothetical protein